MTLNARAARWVALFCISASFLLRVVREMMPRSHLNPFLSISPSPRAIRTNMMHCSSMPPCTILPSTQTRAIQRITRIGGTLGGFDDVSTVLDSTVLLRDTTAVVQEFFLAQSPEGDLYRFGLLAEIARIIRLPVPPKRWDRIAAFSQGFGQWWVVGYLDSAQQKTVYGSFVGIGEMFSARVNGVQNVFSCYRVSISGEGLDYSFWVSDSPPAFLRYILEPGATTEGAEFTLTDVRMQ